MRSNRRQVLAYAFRQTLPVMFGYLFLGLAYGILLRQAGFAPGWALLTSGIVYAGSLQFVLVDFLATAASLPTVALMTLFINGRHLFYGLSFVERFQAMGKKRPYMIFSLSDETYSVLCGMAPPPGIDRDQAMFLAALLDHSYWIVGSVLGTLVGQLPLDFTGIDFSMTALFFVIFLDQWRAAKSHLPALLGLGSALIFLLVWPENFLLPALATTAVLLLLCRPAMQAKEDTAP